MFRCGNGGEVFIRWNRLQSNNVFDGATRTVHGDCSGERECVDWDRTVAAFIRCIYRWFFSWSLPHHRHCYSYLHPGSSPSVPLSYFFFFFFLADSFWMWPAFLLCLIIYGFYYSRLGIATGGQGQMSSSPLLRIVLFYHFSVLFRKTLLCINLSHNSHPALYLLQFFYLIL